MVPKEAEINDELASDWLDSIFRRGGLGLSFGMKFQHKGDACPVDCKSGNF